MNTHSPEWMAVTCPRCKMPPGRRCNIAKPWRVHRDREKRASAALRRHGILDGLWCPVCGRDAILVGQLDRYLHLDGTDNQTCWAAISAGGDW